MRCAIILLRVSSIESAVLPCAKHVYRAVPVAAFAIHSAGTHHMVYTSSTEPLLVAAPKLRSDTDVHVLYHRYCCCCTQPQNSYTCTAAAVYSSSTAALFRALRVAPSGGPFEARRRVLWNLPTIIDSSRNSDIFCWQNAQSRTRALSILLERYWYVFSVYQ